MNFSRFGFMAFPFRPGARAMYLRKAIIANVK